MRHVGQNFLLAILPVLNFAASLTIDVCTVENLEHEVEKFTKHFDLSSNESSEIMNEQEFNEFCIGLLQFESNHLSDLKKRFEDCDTDVQEAIKEYDEDIFEWKFWCSMNYKVIKCKQ